LTSIGQDVPFCDLKVIEGVSKVKIDISEFSRVDTLVNGHSYNVHFHCKNGTIVLGNIDKKGIMNGRWSFDRLNSTGYEGHIVGSFKDGKMDGYWAQGPYSSLYKRGKHIKTTRIPF